MEIEAEMETVPVAAQPDDLLASVLGLLPARSLAAARGVCTAWRDLIDERQLLLPLLLPHSVRGLFINYEDYHMTHFLSRPTPADDDGGPCQIDGKFDFINRQDPNDWCLLYEVLDQCNGLVLVKDAGVLHVCNPATRWSARLPPYPAGGYACYYRPWVLGRRAFLVFDPSVSPEYKVLLPPAEPIKEEKMIENDDECRLMEWPPSAWKAWHEFSSSTGRWVEKVFVREGGEAAGTAGDLLINEWGFFHVDDPSCRYAAYWKGALYVHCRGEFVSRLSLLDDKYRVIKSPIELGECKNGDVRSFLGRSEKGVYIAAIAAGGMAKLRVWTLTESGDRQMEWVPKHQSNLKIDAYSWWLYNNNFDEQKYWILDLESENWMDRLDNNGRENEAVSLEQNVKNEDVSLEQQNVSWNSDDDDNVVDVLDLDRKWEDHGSVDFLGFHPYKEVIFLRCNCDAVACHLNNPKVQYIGSVRLGRSNQGIRGSFVYTPSLTGN